MANTGVSHSEVKSICNDLECSPSQHQASSSIYSGSETNPTAKKKSGGKSAAEGSEKGFKAGRKMATK